MSNTLMQYISDPAAGTPVAVAPTEGGAGKYHGAVASGYDAKREQSPKWILEQVIIEDMLGSLRKGDWVVDVPCGTGRFFDHYARRGFIVRGIDLSADMLAQAEAKITNHQTHRLARGDIRALPFADKSCDAVVSCRVTRWLSPDDCKVAMREWQRIARKKIIFTARIANHPHARSLELFESALDGWRIARNEVGIDMDYRVVCLEPV